MTHSLQVTRKIVGYIQSSFPGCPTDGKDYTSPSYLEVGNPSLLDKSMSSG